MDLIRTGDFDAALADVNAADDLEVRQELEDEIASEIEAAEKAAEAARIDAEIDALLGPVVH